MEAIAITLGLAVVVLVAVVVALLTSKGRFAADCAAAGVRAERAESEERRARAEVASKDQKLAESAARCELLEKRVVGLEAEADASAKQHATDLKHAQEILAEQLKAVEARERQLREEMAAAREQMREAFRSLSAETLSKSAQDFLKLAEERLNRQAVAGAAQLEEKRKAFEQLVKPVADTLAKTDAKLAEIEKSRLEGTTKLSEQLRSMVEASSSLRDETGKLTRALREPHVRGRYGEIQLRRVAELAGMAAYCDFAEQDSTLDSEGNALRPDMVVRLPNERSVVVDSKTNIQGYLDALQADSPAASDQHLDRFARHVADQATALARKKYWTQYDGSPEFVVMFIPGDQFIDAALARQPEILENAARQGVIIASPSTLIGLLRAVHVGYKEQRLAASAEELRRLGVEFHERAATAFAHFAGLGEMLERTVNRYNEFVGSYRNRLEPTLKRFESDAKSAKELPEVAEVSVRVRETQGLFKPADQP